MSTGEVIGGIIAIILLGIACALVMEGDKGTPQEPKGKTNGAWLWTGGGE